MDALQNPRQPDPPLGLQMQACYHVVHTLASLLPPALADTQEALLARNEAAIAEVADLRPVNANEARLAAQCVAAHAKAHDVLRLLSVHDGDIKIVMKLNTQCVSMVRTSLAAHGHLLLAQAVRHKREKSDAAVNADAWMQHVVAGSMQQALDAAPVPAMPAGQAAPAPATGSPAPEPAQVAPPPTPVLAAELSPAPATQPQVPAILSAAPPPSTPVAAPPPAHRGGDRRAAAQPRRRAGLLRDRLPLPRRADAQIRRPACRPTAISVLRMMRWCAPSSPAPARPCAPSTVQPPTPEPAPLPMAELDAAA